MRQICVKPSHKQWTKEWGQRIIDTASQKDLSNCVIGDAGWVALSLVTSFSECQHGSRCRGHQQRGNAIPAVVALTSRKQCLLVNHFFCFLIRYFRVDFPLGSVRIESTFPVSTPLSLPVSVYLFSAGMSEGRRYVPLIHETPNGGNVMSRFHLAVSPV